MAMNDIKVTIRIAWWLRWYLYGVCWMIVITGLQPDMRKVEAWINRGVRVCYKGHMNRGGSPP